MQTWHCPGTAGIALPLSLGSASQSVQHCAPGTYTLSDVVMLPTWVESLESDAPRQRLKDSLLCTSKKPREISGLIIQLALGQHGFDLPGSTYMQIFSNKYCKFVKKKNLNKSVTEINRAQPMCLSG